jgi:putative acetyltransferase
VPILLAGQDVHALDIDGLRDPSVGFFSYRADGQLLAVGAIKQLDPRHAEVKSMHTAQAARGRGIGRAMLDHLIGVARDCGCDRVSLETGTMAAFAPARALYASAGFTPCGPFGSYAETPSNTFMTLVLAPNPAATVTQLAERRPGTGHTAIAAARCR